MRLVRKCDYPDAGSDALLVALRGKAWDDLRPIPAPLSDNDRAWFIPPDGTVAQVIETRLPLEIAIHVAYAMRCLEESANEPQRMAATTLMHALQRHGNVLLCIVLALNERQRRVQALARIRCSPFTWHTP